MHISTYFSISAALFLTLLPTTLAQNAVSLISQLPLEIRSPYMGFWTTLYSPSTNLNTTDYFFTQAVSDNTFLIHTSQSLSCIVFVSHLTSSVTALL